MAAIAKKRKLRSSEPEPVITLKAEETQIVETAKQDVVAEEEAQPHGDGMEEDEADGDGEEDDDGDEEEEEADEEELENELQAEANGDDGEDDELEEEPVEKILEPFSKEQLASLVKEAVEKFPEFISSVHKLADLDPAHRKIFVHGLGWDTTAETLISEFGKYGVIEDCKAVTDKVSGKSKGYAFILFKHRSGARKALVEPQKKIGSRMTSSQLASAGPGPGPVHVSVPSAPPASEYTQRKIFVSNVSADIDPEKLLEFFKQFGEIEDGPLGIDKQTGKPKGFALFVYKTAEGAKKALDEPHKNFEGFTLHCQKAIDGPKQGKQHTQQQQHYQQQHYPGRKDKNRYPGGNSGAGRGQGMHMMPPGGGGMGFNPAVAAQALNPAIGHALTALLATQGAGFGLNLLGGMNQGGAPVMYGNQAGYGNSGLMQGGYPNPQMGQSSGGRPSAGNKGLPPYMGQ